MRILQLYVDDYDANDKDVTKLLETTQLWFVPVMNPDGYQYTFQSPDTRLWRKNLRDNNGNGHDRGRRRRRPEPQLPGALELRRRGLVERPVERDLPRPVRGLGAGDAGDA